MAIAASMQADSAEYRRIFSLQKENQYNIGKTTAAERRAKLKKLKYAIEIEFRDEIREAAFNDMGKSRAEVDLTEIFAITGEAKHAIRKIGGWMADHKVATPLSMLGASSWIRYEPKGVCLIISPWNFPFNLTFVPLVSAIAAGNTAIIKPSEHTPHSSALMKKIIQKLFPENEVALFEGGIETSSALLELPFNHIFFTGAPSIGKIVMAAAAKNLTSVTLELGGKSPTIIDESANIDSAAKLIAWGKFSNSGQICIAPDYIFIHESKKDEFVRAMKRQLDAFFGEEKSASKDIVKVVNQNHFDRIRGYLDDAIAKGARLISGGGQSRGERFIEPALIENVALDSELMKNEIFGPVLPIFPYSSIDEPLNYIRENEKPLALYIYSKNRNSIKKILEETRAGGTCINHNVVHFLNHNLPFGGSNNSGIGKGHGRFGFEAFSNARGIMKQHIPGALQLLMPPYNEFKEKLIALTVRWF